MLGSSVRCVRAPLRAAGFGCDPSGASGSSNLCTPDESGKLVPVEPRWATECGSSVQAVAKINADVKIGDCDPLDDDGTLLEHQPHPDDVRKRRRRLSLGGM